MVLYYILNKLEKKVNDYSLSSLGTFEIEILEELQNVKYKDLEDLVCRFQQTYDEIIDILDLKIITGSTKGYTTPPGINEISDFIMMLEPLLPKEVKLDITIDNIRLKSNLIKSKTIRFTKKIFYRYYIRFYRKAFSVIR